MTLYNSYEDYEKSVNQNLSALERATDKVMSTDERLNELAKIQIETLKVLRLGLLPAAVDIEQSPYSIRSVKLDESHTVDNPFEIDLTGSYLTFYTTGTFKDIKFALDSPANDWIPISYFGNPYSYPTKFNKLFLSWISQPDKELWIHIGRKAGTSPGATSSGLLGVDILRNDYGTLPVRLDDNNTIKKLYGISPCDGKGDIFYYDSFENGLVDWHPTGNKGITSISKLYSNHAIRFTAIPGPTTYFQRILSNSGKKIVGAELSFMFPLIAQPVLSIRLGIQTYFDNNSYIGYTMFDYATSKLYSYNPLEEIAYVGSINTSNVPSFNKIKLVINPITGKYVRIILNGLTFDISNNMLTKSPTNYTGYQKYVGTVIYIFIDQSAALTSEIFLDDIIITENEPES
jgi:hypothetical protein